MDGLMGLNIFDIVVIALILLLSIKGLLNGFGKELLNALGLIGGIFLAAYFYKDAALYIQENFLDISINVLNLISAVAIFALTWLIGSSIGKLFNGADLSAVSRLGGMLVKLISTFLIFSLIIYAFSTKKQIVQNFKSTLDSSKLYTLLRDTGAEILNMPADLNNGNPQETTEEGTVDQNETKAAESNESKENTTAPAASKNETSARSEENKTEKKPVKLEDIKPTQESNASEEKAADANSSTANTEKNAANSDTNSSEK